MFTFIFWDYKEQLPLDELRSALVAIFEDGGPLPLLTDYDDGSDSYYLLISSREFSREEQDAAYDLWMEGYVVDGVDIAGEGGAIPESALLSYMEGQA